MKSQVLIGRELKFTEREQTLFTKISVDSVPYIAEGKKAVVVYHRATNRYYGTIVSDPMAFYRRLSPTAKSHHRLAIALLDLLKISSVVDVYFTEIANRGEFEYALTRQGVKRIATARGRGMDTPSRLWEVHNPSRNITYYLAAPADKDRNKIIATAEEGLTKFLKSCNRNEETLQNRMRPICSWSVFGTPKLFESSTIVNDLGDMPVKPTQYATFTHSKNVESMMLRTGLTRGF